MRDFVIIVLSIFMQNAVTVEGERGNLALHQPATQSSTYRGYIADKAVDGNNNQNLSHGSCTHTDTKQNTAWWQVDLGAEYRVERMNIFYRKSAINYRSSRLNGYTVYVSQFVNMINRGVQCHSYYDRRILPLTVQNFNCNHPIRGRYVTVYNERIPGSARDYIGYDGDGAILELCEVQIYGTCGDGYYGNDCIPCSEGCSNICRNTDGHCYCKSGFTGYACSECEPGNYGNACELTCPINCKDRSCDVQRGTCYMGCNAPYFGRKCTEQCNNCEDGMCDQKKGFCKTGCVDGKYGKYLMYTGVTYENVFMCNNTCPTNCLDNNCDSENGQCHECEPGYYGNSCELTCPIHCKDRSCDMQRGTCYMGCNAPYFGRKCTEQCNNCEDGMCDQKKGFCKTGCVDGKYGKYFMYTGVTYENAFMCNNTCPTNCLDNNCDSEKGKCNECIAGKYGYLCNQNCSTGCSDNICLRNGSCKSGCVSGFYDTQCKIRCPEHCSSSGCDRYSGYCLQCRDGYYGNICNLNCPTECISGKCDKSKGSCSQCNNGFFGLYCNNTCSNGCSKDICDQVTGRCTEECKVGYSGFYCNACTHHTYGFNCESNCGNCFKNASCHIENGTCLNGCKETWTGDKCDEKIMDYAANQEDAHAASIAIPIVLLLLICVLVLLAIVLYKRWKKKNKKSTRQSIVNRLENFHPSHLNNEHVSQINDSTIAYNHTRVNAPVHLQQTDNVYTNDDMKWIPVTQLAKEISRMKTKNLFEEEYNKFPKGAVYPCTFGQMPENKQLNRFLTTFPYDHSRVVLTDRLGSDYINANYIDSVDSRCAYIATQGPRKNTIKDFWRMVWQVKSCKIVMLTNLIENGRAKCDKYWPNSQEPLTAGHMTISLTHEEEFAFYTIKTLKAEDKQTTECRTVEHFHFVTWPDHGTPDPIEMMLFHRRYCQTETTETTQEGPAIIHCSAGIGRSGTFIGLDALYKYGSDTARVNVFEYVKTMRKDRMDMIQTIHQYKALYETLSESFKFSKSCIKADEFLAVWTKDRISSSNNRRTKQEFQILQDQRPQYHQVDYRAAEEKENKKKNRTKILPLDRYRPFLASFETSRNNYINAVTLPSLKQLSGYLVTHYPLPDTIVDFWCMVYDQNSRTVVTLDEINIRERSMQWYPQTNEPLEFGKFTLQKISDSVEYGNIKETEIKLINKSANDEQMIKLFVMNDWPCGRPVPSTKSSLVKLLEVSDHWSATRGNGPVTAVCSDGAVGCGLFCACNNIIQTLRFHKEINVLLTMVQLQARRPEFFKHQEQYQFCYQFLEAYLESANVYVN